MRVSKSFRVQAQAKYPRGSSWRLNRLLRVLSAATVALVGTVGVLSAQTDPGVRGGAPGAGGPIMGLTQGELDFFNIQAVPDFIQVEDVPNNGLGPRFNLDSCGGCHAQPTAGGTSPAINPQVAKAATLAPPPNKIPAFLSLSGPVREARFVKNPDGTPDGGVHDLFVITGRADAPAGCAIQQPDFAQALAQHNVIFRIPTPVYGAGLMEAINNATLKQNLASDPDGKRLFSGSRAASTPAATMALSHASAGRRRISRSRFSRVRPITWRWVLPTKSSRTSAQRIRIAPKWLRRTRTLRSTPVAPLSHRTF